MRNVRCFRFLGMMLFSMLLAPVFSSAGGDENPLRVECGGCYPGMPIKSVCAADIQTRLAPEAQLTQFDCRIESVRDASSLLFLVGVKNISDKPLQYRLNIALVEENRVFEQLVPMSGRSPVVQPGKIKTVRVHFPETTALPKKVRVRVSVALF